MSPTPRALALALLAPLACAPRAQDGASPAAAATSSPAAATSSPAAATSSPAAPAGSTPAAVMSTRDTGHPPAGGDHVGGHELDFPAAVAWTSFDEAKAQAAREGKRIMVLVYTDWCPRCKELAPALNTPDFIEASKKLVVVRQDQGAKPPWLDQYASQGAYVPRVLFLEADGTLLPEITSSHPRYPLFYAAHQVVELIGSMTRAASGTVKGG